MRTIIAILFTIGSASALACMPGGQRMTDNEKAEFAQDLRKQNPQCARLIKNKIGNINKTDVSMWVQSSDNLKEYTVIGLKGQMNIDYVKVMGKMQYSCGPVTGRKRGC